MTLLLLSGFSLATLFFYFAAQRPLDYTRHTLSSLHILSASIPICLRKGVLHPVDYGGIRVIMVPFVVYSTIHTSSILCMERRVINVGSTQLVRRLRDVYRVWSNIRRVRPIDVNTQYSRAAFAMRQGSRALALWAMHRVTTKLTSHTFRRLNITLGDFAPDKRGLLPQATQLDLCLRAIVSVQWIWDAYVSLTAAHAILSIFFVSILHWDRPDEWPVLFGNIAHACSLRRFWGTFWHRLHIVPFATYMPPSFARGVEARQPQVGRDVIGKAFRALWMFLLSAVCHAIINWAVIGKPNAGQELRFFLSNYAVCLAETVTKRAIHGKRFPDDSIWVRLCGYVWVMVIFFCLVPAWQYSWVYTATSFQA